MNTQAQQPCKTRACEASGGVPASASQRARWAFITEHLRVVEPSAYQVFALTPRLASAYFHLHDDSAVARFALLPHHANVDEARRWIADQRATGQRLLAVAHRDHGLIGALCIRRNADLATFYYWIGQAFRGMGHARHLLALLKAHAAQLQIRRLYSAVDHANIISLRALSSAGFRCLGSATVGESTAMEWVTCRLAADGKPDADENVLRIEAGNLFETPPVRRGESSGRGKPRRAR
jgi:RimJ/RimL family protein N-acetyltransferase